MPVTAKLSKEFYDKFGHAVVDELVTWFNQWMLRTGATCASSTS